MKKTLAFVLSTLILLALAGPISFAESGVTINFMADTSLVWDKLNPLIEQFTAETGIKVNTLVLEESNLWSKTGLEVSAPSTDINVIMGHTRDILAYSAAGYLEPLEPLLEKYDTFSMDDYAKAYLDACRGKDDGVLYGIPMYHNGTIMIYRADIFAKHNITLPETWEDLEAVCAQLKELEPDMAAFATRGQNMFFGWTMVYSGYGGKYLDENNSSIMDAEIAEKATTYLVNLLNNYAPEGIANYNYSEIQTDFMQGKLAAFLDSYNVSVRCENPDESPLTAGKIGYWTMPAGTTRVGPGFTWSMIIPKNTTHKEEAAQFLAWLMSPEIASAIEISSPKQTWDKVFAIPAYEGYDQSISMREAMERTFEFVDCDYNPRNPRFGELRTLINSSLTACLTGSIDPATAAQEIIEAAQSIYP